MWLSIEKNDALEGIIRNSVHVVYDVICSCVCVLLIHSFTEGGIFAEVLVVRADLYNDPGAQLICLICPALQSAHVVFTCSLTSCALAR